MPKKLTKAELFYLAENPDELSAEQLSKDLGYGVPIIKKYLKPKVKELEVVKVEEPKQEIVQSIPFDENTDIRMGKRVSEKSGKILATVMTEAASQAIDLSRERKGTISLRDSIKTAIHKCKGKRPQGS